MERLSHNYVDNSNFFIEGQRVAAVDAGMAADISDAINRKIFDYSWQPDYGKLCALICGEEKQIGCAKLWGSPPPADSFWTMVERKGFKVKTYERSYGKERKVDVAIAYEIGKDVPKMDKATSEIILVAGDKDFVPIVEDLTAEGYHVCVAFWDHASAQMKARGSSFFSLNPYIKHLARIKR
jgi:hypothetical protein